MISAPITQGRTRRGEGREGDVKTSTSHFLAKLITVSGYYVPIFKGLVSPACTEMRDMVAWHHFRKIRGPIYEITY
jgi:hypothetical protein